MSRQGLYQCPVRHGEKPKVPKAAVNICHLHHQGSKASAPNHLPLVPLWLPSREGELQEVQKEKATALGPTKSLGAMLK